MKMTAALILIAIALLFTLAVGSNNYVNKTNLGSLEQGSVLPMTFAHLPHKKEPCAACHHNYTDGTGSGQCLHCHQTAPEIQGLFEQQFHTLCRGCHEEKQMANEKHGPIRSCIACHTKDNDA